MLHCVHGEYFKIILRQNPLQGETMAPAVYIYP